MNSPNENTQDQLTIIDYSIIESDNREYLIQEVKNLIKKDWQPLGAVVVLGSAYFQTLVKYKHINKS